MSKGNDFQNVIYKKYTKLLLEIRQSKIPLYFCRFGFPVECRLILKEKWEDDFKEGHVINVV